MSNRLILMRHADALPNKIGEKDFDRSLSEKGINEINQIAQFFIEKKIRPDHILASSAKRTTQTAKRIASIMSINEENISLYKALYNSTAETITQVINLSDIPQNVHTLLLIAHNPGISELASTLLSQQIYVDLPPCGMLTFSLEIENWTSNLFNKTELLFQKFPKF